MNLFQHFMGRQPYGLQAQTGGGMQPMQANTGGGLPAMAQGFPSVQTGGGLPPVEYGKPPGMTNLAPPGGYGGPSVQTGGNLQPQQAHGPYWQGDWRQQLQGELAPQTNYGQQYGGGLARMFGAESPYRFMR